MLEILNCDRPEDKRRLFSQLDPQKDCWVVSDLQSKWHLQKELLNQHGVLEQDTVLRATELWKKLSFRLLPEIHLLSTELARTLFWNWIEPMGLQWARSPQAVPVVMNQMQMWMSIFSDPNHEEIMSQWFAENRDSYVRWGHWFELCSLLWKRCQEENLLMVSWLPAVLLQQDLSELRWSRRFKFDLGPQMSQVEGQLIKELSRSFAVGVVHPQAPWISLMKNTLRPYEVISGEPESGLDAWQPSVSEQMTFGRFSTQLAETKDAVARVRQWLSEGVRAQDIAIVSPDIEEYWPSLQLYFEREGIPVCKPLTAKLGGFVEIAQWLSQLRTAMARVSSGDLEVALFTGVEQPRLKFDEFRVLFTHVYDAHDLKRAEGLFANDSALDFGHAISMAEFLAWSLKFWNRRAEQQRLFQLLQVIGEEVPRALTLKPAQWLKYLEGIIARREMTLRPADEKGIWCVALSSADWLPVTHGIFLNLNEGALRTLDQSPVTPGEAQKIFTDTGYALGTTDRQEHEFEFLWFLTKEWRSLRLGFSASDFQGQVLTPSRLWIWAGIVSGQFKHDPESPLETRWDEIQRLGFSAMSKGSHADRLQWALQRDVDVSLKSWAENTPPERLSASGLERYWKCPFIFGAERQLKLSDDPVLDLDLDRRGRGSLLHAIVETLCEEPVQFERSDTELGELIDAAREREGIQLGDDRLWPAIRAQHIRLARSFLAMEREWRARFPETQTVGRELQFKTHLDGVLFSGRIDRVDRDSQGRYAVIDYKASNNGLTNWKSWLPGHKIQLALYAQLVEQGLTELPAGEVAAANYYVVKNGERHKGFQMKDPEAKLYSPTDKASNWLNDEEKREMFAQLQGMLKQAVSEISSGQLVPQPAKFSECESCAWRTLCRAPHLN